MCDGARTVPFEHVNIATGSLVSRRQRQGSRRQPDHFSARLNFGRRKVPALACTPDAKRNSELSLDTIRGGVRNLRCNIVLDPVASRRSVQEKDTSKGQQTMATTTTDTRETSTLIGSDQVEGTTVYGRDAQAVGEIERVMIDKISGKVAYAVMSFGGFMGIGEDYYPVPWSMLSYDTSLGGYRTNISREQLDRAPKYSESTSWNWNRDNDRRVYDYYRTEPYWID